MTDTTTTKNLSEVRRPADAFYAFLIVALAPIGQMGIDIFTPSLPLIVKEFGSSREYVQLSVSLYLAAFAVGQLIYGPISDSIGRRASLNVGLVLFLVGSAITLIAPAIEIFVIGRIVQGLGITCASVLMRAIATDMFKPPRLANVLTYMVIGWGMGPIVAPVIGATFQTTIGWHYSLVFLAVYAVILLGLTVFVMKETNSKLVPFSFGRVGNGIIEVYGSLRFILIFFAMGFCYGAILSFNLVGPFIVQSVMGYGPEMFGGLALAMGFVYFAGVFSNRLMPSRVTQSFKFSVASAICLVASLAQLALAMTFDLQLWALIAPFALVVFFSGVMYPNLMALGLSAFPHIAGLASSLLGFSLMVIAAGIMLLSTLLQVQSLVPFAVLTLALMGGVYLLIRKIQP